ncbi:hypothetical protein [Persephonella sp.]
MKIGPTLFEVNENVITGEFNVPFIPPSKLDQKDKYEPFKGSITVEPERLFAFYKILDESLKGKFLNKMFLLKGDTLGERVVVIVPPETLSENAKKKGAIYGIKLEHRKEDKIHTGRVYLSLTLINVLKNEIKKNGKLQKAFIDIDEEERPHVVIIERNKGKVKVVYPIELELAETKRSKLEIALNAFKQGLDKVPTTIVGSKVVFRKNSKGQFVIHTPHHSVRLEDEDIDDLLLLVQN